MPMNRKIWKQVDSGLPEWRNPNEPEWRKNADQRVLNEPLTCGNFGS